MNSRRLRRQAILGSALAIAVIASTFAALSRISRSTQERELLRHAGVGLAFGDSLERDLTHRRSTERISPAEAVASLYLERLRLGMGSPFRLIDQALRDSSLSTVGGTELAETMLSRTMIGDAYRPRSSALDLVYTNPDLRLGAQHQAIIDSVVASFPDPRTGELAIRLAYRMASASGAVSRRAPEIATAAAAQARDRILSMRDARALFNAAERDGVSRLTLLRVWREARRFEVEQPVIAPLSTRQERNAVASLPSLLARIEGVARAEHPFLESARDVIGKDAERRRGVELPVHMAAIAQSRDHPPLAPVMVAVRGYSGLLRYSDGSERLVRQRFIDRVSNEETLAAEYALLTARLGTTIPEADAVILTGAVALRPFAQERAWLTGDPAPSVRDLQARFGITVTFDATARPSWRPYFQRSLEAAILDMRRVLPGFDPRGLHVHFGANPLGDRALALHDPIRRTIYFPPTSHSGVMAHEFAHDLDWQAARREYGGTGWYRTDHALRQSVDQLAGALRLMASATRSDSMSGATRPTEVLARNVDWFVSASLAREGRVNGHLSAAQDPVLTGYASAITPEAARDGGSATLRALDGLTMIPSVTRSWFTERFGAERRLGAHEAVRRVLEAPLGRINLDDPAGFTPWNPAALERELAAVSENGWTCFVDAFAGRSEDAATVRAVIEYAAESRARGVVRQWAEYARLRPLATPSRLRALTGAPWNPSITESTLREIRDAILWSTLNEGRGPGNRVVGPVRSNEAGC